MDFLKSLVNPEEMVAMIRLAFGGGPAIMTKFELSSMSPTMRQCFDLLKKGSVGFSFSIRMLAGELRTAVCIYYLVLRALDTVEDDMTIPVDTKVPMLKSFYKNLQDPDWKFCDSKDKNKIVLENFPAQPVRMCQQGKKSTALTEEQHQEMISQEFRQLKKVYREVISETCKQMGEGMAVFLRQEINDLNDWNEYCHVVAGLVGIGLTKMFSDSGLEDTPTMRDLISADFMGIFFQKTNIIEDYFDDVNANRRWWPKSIWSKYVSELEDLVKPENREKGVQCVNELITNNLELLPTVILRISGFRTQSIFTVVAIPQLISFATLVRCYNNPDVFSGVVKIRKGQKARLIMAAASINHVMAIMRQLTHEIIDKVQDSDPSAAQTRDACQKVLEALKTHEQHETSRRHPVVYLSLGLLFASMVITGCSQLFQLWETFF